MENFQGKMNNPFSSQMLAEKLSKLNNSQQSIESLSNWCTSHRKKAKQIVETWQKMFSSSPKEQGISFLYLANDILQNSRRKGSEFVNEFWKVLPGALKSVLQSGDDNGKNAVMRLVNIWDERKVFGSRGRVLKDEILSKESIPFSENNGKSPEPIKIVKKDAQSIRIKLAVGGMPEKIVTAFQSILNGHFNEDEALDKCNAAVSSVRKMEKDVEDTCVQGNQQEVPFASEIQEQEQILKQCIKQLESIEATRAALVSQLKEALKEQESKLEFIHSQLEVARNESEHASVMCQRLMSVTGLQTSISVTADTAAVVYQLPDQASNDQPQQAQPITTFTSSFTTAEEQHRKAAAAVAAKLAASTSSEQILNSVLSSFVAEEAASKNGGQKTEIFSTSSLAFPMAKRPKLEKPMAISEMGNPYLGHVMQQQLPIVPSMTSQASVANFHSIVQINNRQPPFPPQSLPPPLPPTHPQYVQASSVMAGVVPYSFGSNSLPPPPPVQSHTQVGLARPPPPHPVIVQTLPSQQPQQQQQQQQQPVTNGFNQTSGMSFFGQPTTAPVHRQ